MKKLFAVLIAVLVASAAFAYPSTLDSIHLWYPPGGAWGYDHASATWRPFGITGSGSVCTHLFGSTDYGERQVDLDNSTHALLTVDYTHHEVHEGDSYTVSSASSALNSGASFAMFIRTASSTEYAHFVYEIDSTGEFDLYLIAEAAVSASGTSQEIFNRNRNSSKACGITAFVGPSFSGGKILRQFRTGSGKTTPGNDRSTAEFILKPSTNYVVQVISRATGLYFTIKLDWYCHADKN